MFIKFLLTLKFRAIITKKTVDGFMGSITYKQYTYYPDVTSAPTTEASTD